MLHCTESSTGPQNNLGLPSHAADVVYAGFLMPLAVPLTIVAAFLHTNVHSDIIVPLSCGVLSTSL